MTATPLPRWKFERVIDGIPCVPTIEAEQACADLEAENQRLREALVACYPIVQHEKFVQDASYGKNFSEGKAERARKAYELTRAALEKQP